MGTAKTIIKQSVNKIGVQGACALSEALEVNTTLKTLNLAGVQHCNNKAMQYEQCDTTKEQNRELDRC